MPDHVVAGRYELRELLGRGGMSEVWAADDRELGRRVALKLLAPAADTARFEREARAVASLSHPNVTRLFDYGEFEGRPFIVLEYLSGGTLESRLADGKPLPDDEAFSIVAGVAAGLAHAHSHGVVHRDLKPSNVLFDAEGRPKLADFGIARLTSSGGTLTEAGTVLGTAAYISPEQAAGEPASPASDVYSFGVMVYRMITGRLPFVASDAVQLLMLHRNAEPPPVATYREHAPVALASLALAALAKEPANRPPDGGALLAELDAPEPLTAPPPAFVSGDQATQEDEEVQAGPSARPPGRRMRTPLMIAAVPLLALAGVMLAYGVTRFSGSSSPVETRPPLSVRSATGERGTPSGPPTPPTTQASRGATSTRGTSTQEATTATTATAQTSTASDTTTTAPATTATTSATTATTATTESTETVP